MPKKSSLLWIALGLLSLLLRTVSSPAAIEQYYSRGFFLWFRTFWDATFARLPFALIYVFVIGGVLWLGWAIVRFFKKRENWKTKILAAFWGILAFVGGGIFLFLSLWGFNYGRLPIEQQLGITPTPLSKTELWTALQRETPILKTYRTAIEGATDSALTATHFPKDLEPAVRKAVTQWLSKNNFPTNGRVRGRLLRPKGIFLRFSSAGLYFPFTGEGHVDAGMLRLEQPFVMAHEMGHGYGFGDEGTCNFIGYLACMESTDPAIRYAAQLNYFRTLALNYLRYEPEAYQEFRKSLPQGIISDLNAINENQALYPDLMPRLRYQAYDAYLKAQGIEEGIKNYNRVVMLLEAWKKRR